MMTFFRTCINSKTLVLKMLPNWNHSSNVVKKYTKYSKFEDFFLKMETLQQNLSFFHFFWILVKLCTKKWSPKHESIHMKLCPWNGLLYRNKGKPLFPQFIANFWNFFCWHFTFLLAEMNMSTSSNLESLLFTRHNHLKHNQEPPNHSSKTWTIGWNESNHSNNPKIDYVW
jgi:hypothetical protein